MKADTYHHGNLKEELIEKGLEYINQFGMENLSLRKLADSAGVSHAAPYAHFKSKEDFLTAVRDYITDRFYKTLKEAVESCPEASQILMYLGRSYVMFFYRNSLYYRFLFSGEDVDTKTYPPFLFFRDIAENFIKELSKGGVNDEIMRVKVIALWAMVHGLASIITIKGAVDTDHLDEEIERILGSITI